MGHLNGLRNKGMSQLYKVTAAVPESQLHAGLARPRPESQQPCVDSTSLFGQGRCEVPEKSFASFGALLLERVPDLS